MQSFLNFLFPPRCQLCGVPKCGSQTVELCAACMADIPTNSAACESCAIPMNSNEQGKCAQCLKSKREYTACWSPFIYAQPLEWMIRQLKFNAKLNFAPLLSALMIKHISEDVGNKVKPDVIIPMPLHKNRLKQRGFNQSLLMAKPLSRFLNIPIDSSSCLRVIDTEHQTGKNARQRRKNIKGAFTFNNHNNYQYVVIFDDVVTTGSSVSELSKVLKKSGVQRVDVWCLARAEKIN